MTIIEWLEQNAPERLPAFEAALDTIVRLLQEDEKDAPS